MKHAFDPGEHTREAIRRATAPARAEAERVVSGATASARASIEDTIRQAARATVPAISPDVLARVAAPAIAPDVLARLRGPVVSPDVAISAAALAVAIQTGHPSWKRAVETARAALADMAAQMDFSPPGLAAAGGGGARLTVRDARAAVTASRPLLSVPTTAEPDGPRAAELRELARRVCALMYAGLSNPAVHGLLTLIAVLIAAAAYDLAAEAFEQDRVNSAVEQQRDATAPPIIVQPAPVTVIPEQREVDRRVDERLRQLGVDPGSGR